MMTDFTRILFLVLLAAGAFYLASTGSYFRAACLIPGVLVVLHQLAHETD